MFIYKNFILYIFLKILQRYCKLVILGNLDMPGYAYLKKIVSTYREPLCLTRKKSTLSPIFSWGYCKDMYINFYFGYFGYVWLRKPKILALTWLAKNMLTHNSRTKILLDMSEIGGEISITKFWIFQKIKKLYLGAILSPFYPHLGK